MTGASFRLPPTPMQTDDHPLAQAMFPSYDATCPKCGAHPFRPFMYGMVVRSPGLGDLWRWITRQPRIGTTTLICWTCKEIVGHE